MLPIIQVNYLQLYLCYCISCCVLCINKIPDLHGNWKWLCHLFLLSLTVSEHFPVHRLTNKSKESTHTRTPYTITLQYVDAVNVSSMEHFTQSGPGNLICSVAVIWSSDWSISYLCSRNIWSSWICFSALCIVFLLSTETKKTMPYFTSSWQIG